jgi:hypothetical protein
VIIASIIQKPLKIVATMILKLSLPQLHVAIVKWILHKPIQILMKMKQINALPIMNKNGKELLLLTRLIPSVVLRMSALQNKVQYNARSAFHAIMINRPSFNWKNNRLEMIPRITSMTGISELKMKHPRTQTLGFSRMTPRHLFGILNFIKMVDSGMVSTQLLIKMEHAYLLDKRFQTQLEMTLLNTWMLFNF